MEKARRFEDLWIWQEARCLVKDIYEDLNQGPGSRDFVFVTKFKELAYLS